MTVKLTPRQQGVLEDIAAKGFMHDEWFRPQDIWGKFVGDRRSSALRDLVVKGLVERKRRVPHTNSYMYRLTVLGRNWKDV